MRRIIIVCALFFAFQTAHAQPGRNILFSFTVKQNGKQVILYEADAKLHYEFQDTNHAVEFSYPLETDEETPGFFCDTIGDKIIISFANKSARYELYETSDKAGVNATAHKILYEQDADMHSKKGNLKELRKMHLDNLIIR